MGNDFAQSNMHEADCSCCGNNADCSCQTHESKTTGIPGGDRETKSTAEKLESWFSFGGLGVLCTGIICPVLLLAGYCFGSAEQLMKLLIKHPVETLVEGILLITVPVASWMAWYAIRSKDGRFARRLGILNGMSIGVSAALAFVCAVMVQGSYFSDDLAVSQTQAGFSAVVLGGSIIAAITGIYLALRLAASRNLRRSRLQSLLYSACGIILSLCAITAAELRSSLVRIAEQMTLCHGAQAQIDGAALLRSLHAERDLIMEGADGRAAGFPGVFIRITPEAIRPVYFAVTGKPYLDDGDDRYGSLPDDYLHRHVIGTPVKGLQLVHSSMNGIVHPSTLSSTVRWTFVFGNDSSHDGEARAEISLPPGAVVNGVLALKDGEKKAGQFAMTEYARAGSVGQQLSASEQKPAPHSWISLDNREPATVTDLGRGRVLLRCFPVPAHGEAEVQLNIACPLFMQSQSLALSLPHFADANFSSAGDHSLSMRAEKNNVLSLRGTRSTMVVTGEECLRRNLSAEDLNSSGLAITVASPQEFTPVNVRNPFNNSECITESIVPVTSPRPQNLVMVLDDSVAARSQLDAIKQGLKSLPAGIHAVVLLSGSQSGLAPVSLQKALEEIKASSLQGGHDNLESVIKAIALAGDCAGGAVLWIHGPQPTNSKKIFIVEPPLIVPEFYEFALDNGQVDMSAFLRQHPDVRRPVSVLRAESVEADLARFLSRLGQGQTSAITSCIAHRASPHEAALSGQQALEVASLWAAAYCNQQIAEGHILEAAIRSVHQHIVTPVSLTAVFSDNVREQIASAQNRTSAARGQVERRPGPSTQATCNHNVTAFSGNGMNVPDNAPWLNAGLVLGSILLIAVFIGMCVLIKAPHANPVLMEGTDQILFQTKQHLYARGRKEVLWGALAVLAGLTTPGLINWMVASARDANLFS